MPIISLAIQKGGSGKTTTAINLGAALRDMGHKVLLIDIDPQANLSQALGVKDEPEGIYNLIHKASSGQEAHVENIIQQSNGLDLIPSSIDLANAELELVSTYGREYILREILKPIRKNYDYIFIDCPPAIGMLTVNALSASDYVIIPLQAEYLPLEGVHSFIHTFNRIRKQLNRDLKILGFLLTKYDERKTMNRQVLNKLFAEYGEQVFDTRIRSNITLAHAQEKGKDIFTFSKSCNGAIDYNLLMNEFIERTTNS